MVDKEQSIASRLIGVIDLRGGMAVHAVAGQRANYQVIDRKECPAGAAVQLAATYLHGPYLYGPSQLQSPNFLQVGQSVITCQAGLYIADLDAIIDGQNHSQSTIADIVDLQARLSHEDRASNINRLFLDRGMFGTQHIDLLRKWSQQVDLHVVIGTESIDNFDQFLDVFRCLREANIAVVISIDLMAETLLAKCPRLEKQRPLEVMQHFVMHGLSQFIVLDLAAVGTSAGPSTIQVCQQAATRFSRVPNFRLISGGGVRHKADVENFVAAGVDDVLVATWLQKSWS